MTATLNIGFLIFPDMTALDCIGPAQVLGPLPGAQIHLIWKSTDPVVTDSHFAIVPTTDIANCPPLDIICVPGGPGQMKLMDDEEILEFIRQQGAQAKYITSVCTGSLLLAKAGLLEGYKAGCHWAWRKQLSHYGATPSNDRVVIDRNRITGGGVTAGIDFGLSLAAELAGEDVAKALQLAFEYDPAPPFDCGTPDKAGPDLTSAVIGLLNDHFPEKADY